MLALNLQDVLLSEGQLRVRGKGNKLRFPPLAPETTQLIEHYLRLERPDPCSAALFVVLKGPARGQPMTPAGLRSLFRHHRRSTGIQLANPHRFRHTFASDMVRAGIRADHQKGQVKLTKPTGREYRSMLRTRGVPATNRAIGTTLTSLVLG